jgi:hypothetical protein
MLRTGEYTLTVDLNEIITRFVRVQLIISKNIQVRNIVERTRIEPMLHFLKTSV